MVSTIYRYGTRQSLSKILETDLRGARPSLQHQLPAWERAGGKGCCRAGVAEGPLLSQEPSCRVMHPHHERILKKFLNRNFLP